MKFKAETTPSGSSKEKQEGRMSVNRREFVAALLGGSVAAVLPGVGEAKKPGERKDEEEAEVLQGAFKEFPQEYPYNPKEYDMGPLVGRVFGKGSLFNLYIGMSGKVPQKAKIDFSHQLWNMWRLKLQKMPRDGDLAKRAKDLLSEYKEGSTEEKNFTTLSRYISEMSKMVETTKKVIDWNVVKKLPELKYLEAKDIDIVQSLSEKIGGKDLVAYSMTELFPSDDGELNKRFMGFLLENAGSGYMQRIPAQDKVRSWSYYQLTEEYAVSERGKEKARWGGASIINQAVDPRFQIPQSMLSMKKGVHHHRGALLFSINSICKLVFEVKRQQSEMGTAHLLKTLLDDPTLLLQYISTAHRYPGYASKLFTAWLIDERVGDKGPGKKISYEEFLKKRGGEILENGQAALKELQKPDTKRRLGKRIYDKKLKEAQAKVNMGERAPALAQYARKTRNNRAAL